MCTKISLHYPFLPHLVLSPPSLAISHIPPPPNHRDLTRGEPREWSCSNNPEPTHIIFILIFIISPSACSFSDCKEENTVDASRNPRKPFMQMIFCLSFTIDERRSQAKQRWRLQPVLGGITPPLDNQGGEKKETQKRKEKDHTGGTLYLSLGGM